MVSSLCGAASAEHTPYLFLPPATSGKKSRQEIELSHSAAKSHIARGIHGRRRVQRRSKALTSGGGDISKSDILSWKRNATRRIVNFGSSNIFGASPTRYSPNAWPVGAPELASPRTVGLLHHCTTVLWPGYDAQGRSKLHPPPFTICWSSLIEPGPVVFHASMWKAAISLSTKTKLPLSEESFQHHRTALRCIRQALNQPPRLVSDEVLFSILILACPDETDTMPPELGPAFNFPFPDLQWLSAYGKTPVTSHIQALYCLVDSKGGIDGLTLPGLAPSVNYLDVIRSTHNLSRPRFPLHQRLRQVGEVCNRCNYFGIIQDPQALGLDETAVTSSDYRNWFLQCGVSDNFFDVLQDMRVWVKVLELYCEGSLASPTLALITVHRFIIQHKLLNTIVEDEHINSNSSLGDNTTSDIERTSGLPMMDRLLQLALLTFALGVTFPVLDSRPFGVVARRLKALVEHYLSTLQQESMRLFGVWICVLGGMAAMQIEDAALTIWFVGAIRKIGTIKDKSTEQVSSGFSQAVRDDNASSRGFRPWVEIKHRISRTFLWFDDACEPGAQVLWDQVRQNS